MTETTPINEPARLPDLLLLLQKRPDRTCTEIGEFLWHAKRRRKRQSYALPAGRLAKAAIALGLVRERWEECGQPGKRWSRRVFRLTIKGQQRAHELGGGSP